MVRYGGQEHSSQGGSHPQGTPQAPVARTPRDHAHREGASTPDGQQGGEARPAEQDDAPAVPRPRQALPRRPSRLRHSESLRAIPSLARFLTRSTPETADAPADRDQAGGDQAGRDQAARDQAGDEPGVPVPESRALAGRPADGGREQADNADQEQAEVETGPRANEGGQ